MRDRTGTTQDYEYEYTYLEDVIVKYIDVLAIKINAGRAISKEEKEILKLARFNFGIACYFTAHNFGTKVLVKKHSKYYNRYNSLLKKCKTSRTAISDTFSSKEYDDVVSIIINNYTREYSKLVYAILDNSTGLDVADCKAKILSNKPNNADDLVMYLYTAIAIVAIICVLIS